MNIIFVMTISQKIGDNIKKARKDLKITQAEMAKSLLMTQQQYSRFENGVFELNYEQILKISKLLKITPNEIFEV